MKKISIIVLALLGCVVGYAQNWYEAGESFEMFFEPELGIVANNDVTVPVPDSVTSSRPSIVHRKDDVVMARVVYRVIDMRLKQNYQLYTPVVSDDPLYASLFRTMLRAIEGGAPIYSKHKSNTSDIRPYFNDSMKIEVKDIPTFFQNHLTTDEFDAMSEEEKLEAFVLKYDPVQDSVSFNPFVYAKYAKNVLKFVIQEVVFFDRHYSRLFTKITAIAPLCAGNLINLQQDAPVMNALYTQLLFWMPFDKLRPYLAAQPVTPLGNDKEGNMCYDEFFDKRLYSSYVLGVNNPYSRMVPDLAKAYEKDIERYYKEIRKLQQEVEADLLMTELNLWEY